MRIIKITKVKPERVYAIQTSTETYIADGLAHHNCYNCNQTLKGNWVEYEKFMRKKYGLMITEEEKVAKYLNFKYSVIDLEEIYKKYKQKYAELKGGF